MRIVAAILMACLLAGCGFVCLSAPHDYDMCSIHCYDGKCTR